MGLSISYDILVREHKGEIKIVEFIGDAIPVIFGASIKRENDAQRAAARAVAMQLTMTSVNEQNRREGLPEVEMGIGLNTGEVVVGNIGSDKRTKYGVVGSPVNLTSRIESCTIGGQILISESTLKDAGSILRIGEQMEIQTKGVEKPLILYDLRGIGGEYNLFLSQRGDTAFPLNQEIPLRYTILEEKQVGETVFKGSLVKLSVKGGSVKGAEVCLEYLIAPLSNIKIQLIDPNGEEVPGDLYGKVIRKLTDSTDRVSFAPTCFSVHFTFVPSEVAMFLQGLL